MALIRASSMEIGPKMDWSALSSPAEVVSSAYLKAEEDTSAYAEMRMRLLHVWSAGANWVVAGALVTLVLSQSVIDWGSFAQLLPSNVLAT